MLKTRVLTALALLAAFLCVLFLLPRPLMATAFGMAAGVAAWEWAGLMAAGGSARVAFVVVVLACCAAGFGVAENAFPILWVISATFWLVAIPFWLRRRWSLARRKSAAYAVGLIVIIPTWAAMVGLRDRSPWLLLAAMALVWVADIAAYFAGRAFGRNKLAPNISPGKTWEGVGGAVVGTLVYALLAAAAAGASPLANLGWAPFLVLLTAISVAGDLFESMIKRQAGVKDSGNLLPGHGGILDRIDSQTSTLPLVALAAHLVAK